MTGNPMINYSDVIADDMRDFNSHHNVHDQYKPNTVEERKSIADADRLPFAIGLMNVLGDLNTAGIIRTAHLTGAEHIFVFGRNRLDNRALVGSDKYSNITKEGGQLTDEIAVDPVVLTTALSKNNYYPIVIEQGGNYIDKIEWKEVIGARLKIGLKPCLLFGNETRGFSNDMLNALSKMKGYMIISLRQRGVIRSYNVCAAAGIAMYHIVNSAFTI